MGTNNIIKETKRAKLESGVDTPTLEGLVSVENGIPFVDAMRFFFRYSVPWETLKGYLEQRDQLALFGMKKFGHTCYVCFEYFKDILSKTCRCCKFPICRECHNRMPSAEELCKACRIWGENIRNRAASEARVVDIHYKFNYDVKNIIPEK